MEQFYPPSGFFHRLGRFLLHVEDDKSTQPLQAKITVLALHALTLVACLAVPYNLVENYHNGLMTSFVTTLAFLVMVIAGDLLFLRFRNLQIARFVMGLAVMVLFAGDMVELPISRGMGPLYFVAGFSLLYFILGFRFGLAFVALFVVVVNVVFQVADFVPESILADKDIRDRMSLIITTAGILGAMAVIFQQNLVRHLSKAAYEDPVTLLANRSRLMEYLEQKTEIFQKSINPLALMAFKLQHFDLVNATHGTTQADAILRECARRILATCPGDALAGRFSGSIFLVAVPVSDHGVLEQLARRIVNELVRPIVLDSGEAQLGADAAISRYPDDGKTSHKILNNIMTTLGRLPPGSGHVFFYDEETYRQEQRRFAMARDLRAALGSKEFHLVYHPKIRLSDGSCTGAEVLLRWNSPVHGSVSPAIFVPLAEESGIIDSLTHWVISSTVKDLVTLAQNHPERFHRLIHAVNLSPLDLASPGLEVFVSSLLASSGLKPGALELEITEGVLMEDNPGVQKLLEDFIQAGFRLAIDDFGTGYSSLSYLHKMKVNNLKIDQSFIRRLFDSESSSPIAGAIISMALAMKLELTAEGVETQEQADWLQERGCTYGQGWLWSKPMRLEDYSNWLLHH